MINPKTGERELAYLVKIDDIIPHNNADKLEIAVIGGWHVIVGKGEFQKGDVGVYFEIDSKLPELEPFKSMSFLESKHFKIKTQKIRGELSQGFACHLDLFKGTEFESVIPSVTEIDETNRFLTEALKVTYSVAADNKRKSRTAIPGVNKYKRMAGRNAKLFKHQPFRWLMNRRWGQKLLYVFFGRRRDALAAKWPMYVKKTDEERVQNMTWILKNKNPWIATEKVDGSSLTVTYKPKGVDSGLFICSRNMVYDETYDNVYANAAKKYKIPEALKDILEKYNLEWVTWQGEVYGEGIQVRNYGCQDPCVAGFNLIFSDRGRLNSVKAKEIMEEYDIPWVPILNTDYILPDELEDLFTYVESETSKIDNGMREGIVFRSPDGINSFKAVSNKYLLKYHG